jgi:tetratricopeptide (TPR) repeat protein
MEASTIYRIAVRPSFIPAYHLYLDARRTLQGNNILETKKQLEESLHLYPEFPGALNDYASLLLESGETKRSEKYLLAALELRPSFGLARLNLARVYEKQNKIGLARHTLEMAWQNADGPEDSDLRGWIQEEQKKLQTRTD